MKNQNIMLLAGVFALGMAGCASVPSMEELTQLNADEYNTAITGNT